MITPELVSYIKKQIQNNIPKDLIISKLSDVGWHIDDINEGFLSIDKYREPLIESDFFEVKKELSEIENKKEEEIKIEKPIIEDKPIEVKSAFEQSFSDVKPSSNEDQIESKEDLSTMPAYAGQAGKPRVWTPMRVPVREISQKPIDSFERKSEVIRIDIKKDSNAIEVQNIELPSAVNVQNTNNQTQPNIDDSFRKKSMESFSKPSVSINPKYFNKNEEAIPSSVPKTLMNSFGSVEKEKDNIVKIDQPIVPEEKSKGSLSDVNLPKIAMLSSYKSDLMSIEKQKEKEKEAVAPKKSKAIKWIILVLIIIAIGVFSWAFANGYISIKNLNIFAIKKDPKVLLLNNSNALSSLKSYKTETNLEISSPSFANISSALMTGETISSNEKDSISINTLGVINQNNQIPVFDNFITIKSSLLQNYITADIKSNGSSLFVSVPDLSQFIGENAPASSTVKINESQFDMIPPLFSKEIETNLKKLNLYNIISSGMSSYINTDTLSAYNDLINNVEIIEKGTENIKGIDTYHYSVNADRQLVKNLLSKISDNFVANLSDDDKNNLDQILGSVNVDSFDIWIGKGDNNIYQYSIVLGVPLSKVIGFEDKSIGDNQVKISWKTTYYDFNITNNLFIPETSIPAVDYINSVKESEMKNDVSSFSQLATNLFGLEKNYGSRSNTKGDCMAPVSGSLFSPIGHSKNSTTVISSISSLLNKILKTTNGNGLCSSTLKDWVFAVPISDNYDPALIPNGGYQSFYCIDSTGAKENLTSLPTGNVCLPKVDSTKAGN